MMQHPGTPTAPGGTARQRAPRPLHPFTPVQLAAFERLLLAERDAMLRSARETASHLQEPEQTPDPSDRASIEEGQSLDLRVLERERRHLLAIAQALERIHDGRYGLCEESGEPIGLARLMARPTATRSLEEQARLESTPGRHHA